MKDIIYLIIIATLLVSGVVMIKSRQDAPEVKSGPVYREPPNFLLWPEDGPLMEASK